MPVYTSIAHFTLILLSIKSETYIIFIIQFGWFLSNSGDYILGINMDRLVGTQEKVNR